MTHKYCKVVATEKPTRARTPAEIDACIEQLARDAVSSWIERGYTSVDMKAPRMALSNRFNEFLLRDMRWFESTGKYPEYAEMERIKSAGECPECGSVQRTHKRGGECLSVWHEASA